MERRYYIAAGESLRLLEAWHDAQLEVMNRRRAFLERLGSNLNYMENGGHMVSVGFDSNPGEDWRSTFDAGYYRPNKRRKAGKEIAKEMAGLKRSDSFQMPGYQWVIEANGIHYLNRQKIGDKWIITVPVKSDFVPPDAIPIKASEYWRMKEEAEAVPA